MPSLVRVTPAHLRERITPSPIEGETGADFTDLGYPVEHYPEGTSHVFGWTLPIGL